MDNDTEQQHALSDNVCPECGKTCQNAAALRLHRRRSHGDLQVIRRRKLTDDEKRERKNELGRLRRARLRALQGGRKRRGGGFLSVYPEPAERERGDRMLLALDCLKTIVEKLA